MSLSLQRQLDTATAFFLAGERCSLDLKFRGYDFHEVRSPTIVSYAFSVELALKLIHEVVRGAPARAHDLSQLYLSLPDAVRSNLPHMSECATELARYFVDWRYPFEKDFLVGDYETPRRAFIECYREIRRLLPDLASVYEQVWGQFDPEWVQSWPDASPRWELRLAGA